MTKFKGTIRKGGNAYVVTIPKAYIDNGLLNTDTEYDFIVGEHNGE
jgi:antitoxin component of MazEF toxin-antitoxin module